MSTLTNFGEQFAGKCIRKFYQTAVAPSITNKNYEGDIKKPGDRLNILSFLSDISFEDYAVGIDMTTQEVNDNEDVLIVEKRKSFSFSLDRLEKLFTYADDIPDTLIENTSKGMERLIDSYVLEQAQYAKAGNWIGVNLRVAGGGSTSGTQASIATTATGGTLTIQGDDEGGNDTNASLTHSVQNGEDGLYYWSGLNSYDVGKPIRLTSGQTWATPWYRITAVTNSYTATIENWDSATAGSDIPNGDILRGLAGGAGDDERTYSQNGDGKPTSGGVVVNGANCGWGYEFQAAAVTTLTASNIYEACTMLSTCLDRQEIPDTDRHITFPPEGIQLLRQASELQPAISMAYEGVVLNGKVGRVAGFDIHMAAGSRLSTRAGHTMPTTQASAATYNGASFTGIAGTTGYQVLANHIGFITFAYKWQESRTIDAQLQFAKLYQGLHLFGAKVPDIRRNAGAVLFCTF